MSDMMCPKCGDGEHVVMVEDGLRMCTQCVIEFNEDGRGNGGQIETGKIGYIFSEPIDALYVATVSASAPLKDSDVPTVNVTVTFKSVANVGEMLEELYKSLKRAGE